MSLAEYERKRKFGETPEPKPVQAEHGGWRFVVQKHKATQLHYDFRLELDGVLKSWAVPKGPSLDPADKRLAMEVEDHPVEYISFEGRIPEGNYGAGTVMVWDQGTWTPEGTEKITGAERESHARMMLEKGDLKFRLNGTKLKGSWVLAKMRSHRPGSKGTEWLLIKHRDEAAESGYEIAAHDGSVVTGRSMEEIAGDKKSDEWGEPKPQAVRHPKARTRAEAGSTDPHLLNAADVGHPRQTPHPAEDRQVSINWTKVAGAIKGARKAAMPEALKPMLATLVEDAPSRSDDWLYEVKWDGYRALAYVEDGKARLVSRNQNDLTGAFAELAAELPKQVRARQALIDGEIVALDESGRSSFSLMQQRTVVGRMAHLIPHIRQRKADVGHPEAHETEIPIVFYAFDLLQVDGWSLLGVALEERKRLLREALASNDRVRYSESFDEGAKLLAAAREQGLEGIIAKRRDSTYEQRRSRAWCKVKITQSQECVIGGWTEPKGEREYFGSLVLGLYDSKGRLLHVGQAGTGFTRETEAEIYGLLKKLETKKNPFANKVESARVVHFVKPELVAQIKFTEWTHEGLKGGVKMRAPVFEGLRVDKTARECLAA
jgi:bifunctional non-homologous end joining protein LigD